MSITNLKVTQFFIDYSLVWFFNLTVLRSKVTFAILRGITCKLWQIVSHTFWFYLQLSQRWAVTTFVIQVETSASIVGLWVEGANGGCAFFQTVAWAPIWCTGTSCCFYLTRAASAVNLVQFSCRLSQPPINRTLIDGCWQLVILSEVQMRHFFFSA